jgi:hypothetical protein
MIWPENPFEWMRGLAPALLLAGVTWWGCGLSIKPYEEREKQERTLSAGLQAQIAGAAAAAQELERLKKGVSVLRGRISRLEEEVPRPSVQASLPEQLTKHFASFGLQVSAVRSKTLRAEGTLPGYSRAYWSASLPLLTSDHKETGTVYAVMDFERSHPFIRVVDFAIQSGPGDPGRQVVTLELMALVRN